MNMTTHTRQPAPTQFTEDYYPDHDGGRFAPIEATTVATWKARAFLENLAIDADGAVFVTVYSHNRVDRYDPATGATTIFAEVPAPPMGLAFDAGGVLWVTAGTLRKGPGYVHRVDRDGAVRQWCEFPDALFINGCTMHPNGRTLLVCESASGRILAIDLAQPGRWDVWLQENRLRSGRSPDILGRTGSRSAMAGRGSASRDADYWSACRSSRMAPPAVSKLRQRVSWPTTSRSGCLVRSTSPRIPNTRLFASTPLALAQHWQAPNRVWSGARPAPSEERPATRRHSM